MFKVLKEKREVQKALEELEQIARGLRLEDLTSGLWLAPLVDDALAMRARRVDERYLRLKHPGLTNEEVIEARIARAQRHGALEGALTSGAATAAVAATFSSGGSAALVTLPAGVLIFVTDLLFTTQLQLQLTYDISVLYGRPVDLGDPAEVRDLLRVAFGMMPEEDQAESAGTSGEAGAKRPVKSIAETASQTTSRMVKKAGRKLLRRALVKLTVPAASIPLSTAMNYYSIGQTAKLAKRVIGGKARADRLGPELAKLGAEAPRLLLEALWLVINADGKTDPEEDWLLTEVGKHLKGSAEGDQIEAAFQEMRRERPEAILRRIAAAPVAQRQAIYQAVCRAAAFNDKLGRAERKVLKRLAEACGTTYDETLLKAWQEGGAVG